MLKTRARPHWALSLPGSSEVTAGPLPAAPPFLPAPWFQPFFSLKEASCHLTPVSCCFTAEAFPSLRPAPGAPLWARNWIYNVSSADAPSGKQNREGQEGLSWRSHEIEKEIQMKVGVRTVLEAGIPESLKLSRLLLLTEAGKPECPRGCLSTKTCLRRRRRPPDGQAVRELRLPVPCPGSSHRPLPPPGAALPCLPLKIPPACRSLSSCLHEVFLIALMGCVFWSSRSHYSIFIP